jgi:glutamate racemase
MIGIFDSGVGGLSVFREIRQLLPEEKYIYYSDNAFCPYGEKTQEFIVGRARWITGLMVEKGADIIVVACNTATAAAIKTLREEHSSHLRFIGMEPAIKPAAMTTTTGVIGVLATSGTLQSEKYLRHKEKYASDVSIIEHVGEGFVELVEKGITEGPEAERVVRLSIKPLIEAGADTIVLGCTHYPFLSQTIKKICRELCPDRNVTIIDPAPAVARHLHELMSEDGLIRNDGYALDLLSSGDDDILKATAANLL